MTKTVTFNDGYKMRASYQEDGFVRVVDTHGEVRSMSNTAWQRMAELAEANGAKLS